MEEDRFSQPLGQHGLEINYGKWKISEFAGLSEQIMEESEYESLPTDNLGVLVMAGSFAGIMEHCVMYPVDFVKTRMQSLRPDKNAVYQSVRHAFKTISVMEGGRTVIRGVNVVIAGAGPAHGVYFSSYEVARKALGNVRSDSGKNNPFANAVAGAIATFCHDAVMNPVDVIKQRLQMYGSPFRGVFDCARSIWQKEGLAAFYRSYTTQLIMNIPFQSLHFVVYEHMRELLNPQHDYDPKTHLVAGATAGAVAAAVTTPFDVAKTLLNTQEENAVGVIVSQGYRQPYVTGMIDALRTIYKLQGDVDTCRGSKQEFSTRPHHVLYVGLHMNCSSFGSQIKTIVHAWRSRIFPSEDMICNIAWRVGCFC